MRRRLAEATLATGDSAPIGSYRYLHTSDTWWWSDEIYIIYGFLPGEVVPTSELLRSHIHPQTQTRAEHVLGIQLPLSGSYCFRHRIIDAHQRVRTVITVGGSEHDARTQDVIGLSGYMVDLTESENQVTADNVANALELTFQSRLVIEQAKGVLVAVYGLAPDAAFSLLAARSQELNTRVSELAERMLQELAQRAKTETKETMDARATVARVLSLTV